jgi:hypothetical protein
MSSVINDTLLAIKSAFEAGVNIFNGGSAVSSSNPLPVAQTDGLSVSGTATVARCDATTTVIKLQAWETQALREAGVPALNWPNDLQVLNTATIPSDNPVAYGYNLLEASGEFPNATWNV